MAYRVIFWKPRPGVDLWKPPKSPIGESVRSAVLGGVRSELLDDIPSKQVLQHVAAELPTATVEQNGDLSWEDDEGSSLIVSAGPQHVEICAFDAHTDTLDEVIAAITQGFGLELYDWGN